MIIPSGAVRVLVAMRPVDFRKGMDGLAAVVGRSCQHCRTAITEQQRLNLLNGAFMACSQCARILYLVEGSS